jgi:hypothetical protein
VADPAAMFRVCQEKKLKNKKKNQQDSNIDHQV